MRYIICILHIYRLYCIDLKYNLFYPKIMFILFILIISKSAKKNPTWIENVRYRKSLEN